MTRHCFDVVKLNESGNQATTTSSRCYLVSMMVGSGNDKVKSIHEGRKLPCGFPEGHSRIL